MEHKQILRNRYGFGLGTLGRDAVYTMVSVQLMFYLTDVLKISTEIMGVITIIIMATRVFDAVNDPFMGVIVDNTHSKYGKFKPWIFGGAIAAGILTILMFSDFKLSGTAFIAYFIICYLAWEISYTANDIAYWSMIPALSQDQKERERIGTVTRICANIGMFAMVVGVVPITNLIGTKVGSMTLAYTILASIAVVVMLVFQFIMLVLVKEEVVVDEKPESTTVKDMLHVILKNDQLLWITVSMSLFMVGYGTTTSFGLYYFKYVFGDESMYAIFALVLGVSQISALLVFPLVSQHMNRKQFYTLSIILVVIGYGLFYIAPINTMLWIAIAGIFLFVGQACIQLLMLMFITDTVEYGHWKFGKRNESVTLSLQAFINKLGNALATGIVGWTLLASGMKDAGDASGMTHSGLSLFKVMMMLVPLIMIVVSYFIYRWKYRIDAEFYNQMIEEIKEKEATHV